MIYWFLSRKFLLLLPFARNSSIECKYWIFWWHNFAFDSLQSFWITQQHQSAVYQKTFSCIESTIEERNRVSKSSATFFFRTRPSFHACYCIKEDIFKWFLGRKKGSLDDKDTIQPNSLKIDFAYRNLKSYYIESWMRERK